MPPVRMMRSISPPAAAARAPMDLAAVYSMASYTIRAFSSPAAMRRSTSMASLVPRWASRPLLPRTSFIICPRSYLPE